MHMCNILNRIITVSRVCICWWNTAESRYSATVLHLRWNQQRDKFKSLSSLRYGTCRHLLLPILQKLATLCYHQVATTCHFLLPPSCRHLPLFVATKLQMPVTVICHQVADASHFLLPPSCGHLALSAATKLRMTVTFCCHQVAGACHFLLPPSCRHLPLFVATNLQMPATFCCHQVADTCQFLLPPSCRHLPIFVATKLQTPATFCCHHDADACHFLKDRAPSLRHSSLEMVMPLNCGMLATEQAPRYAAWKRLGEAWTCNKQHQLTVRFSTPQNAFGIFLVPAEGSKKRERCCYLQYWANGGKGSNTTLRIKKIKYYTL